ncbi:MAG TPA: S9 family peptidase [Candidatus Limnocylindrales bacterium]|nr:S9 family peptidase [Candidatus Limnocylindrales bacterium]
MAAYSDFEPSRRLGRYSLALSPDGNLIAYADDALGQFNVVVQSISGGEPRRLTSFVHSAVKKIAWHPDGRSLFFLADTGGRENMQLFRLSVEGGEPEALTDAPAATFEIDTPGEPFSPDGRFLAYGGNDRAPIDQDMLVRDLESGQVRRIFAGGGHVWNGHWSKDGKYLTVGDLRVPYGDHVVHLIEVATGRSRALTSSDLVGTYWLGPWLADGSGFLVRSNASREFQGLAVMSAETGELSWLDTPEWDVEEAAISADGRILVWTVNVDGATRLRARDLRTGQDLPAPDLPVGGGWALNLSRDGRRVVLLLSTPVKPWNVIAADLEAGDAGWVTDIEPARVDSASLIQPTLVRYPTADGARVPAYLYRPRSRAPVGVVIFVHGGPSAQERPEYAAEGMYQYLASQGVAVMAPNIRGSRGYGRTYLDIQNRDWGGIDLRDIAAAVSYLRSHDWVDPARIGLFGRSYGGFMVLSCLSRLPELQWAAGVSWCGPSNLITLARTAPPTWRSKVAVQIGDYEADAEFLTSRSPVTHAGRIKAPLLVLQGANDRKVPRHESDQMVRRLRAAGVPVRYHVYPDEGHDFTKRANEIRARTDAVEFLLAHLR